MKTNMKAEDLRKSIYQRAIQGKLVPQDPNDEPASVLLERIKTEKEQLIKEGKIKRDKNESYIFKGDDNRYYEKVGEEVKDITDDLPFEIPENWSWIRLGALTQIFTGNSINENEKLKKYTNLDIDGFDYIATKDVSFDRTINYSNGVRIPKNTNFKICPAGSILMCIEGGSAGRKIALSNQDVCFGNKLACFAPSFLNQKFLFIFLQSPNFQQIFKDSLSGIIGGVSINKVKSLFVPVPPDNEQNNIVESVNILEPPLIDFDIYEKELSDLENNFPEQLKKSILQYAIQGKLVPQDPNDEPASVLLERIKAEKEQLIKEGKIKRDKNESVIYQGDDKNYYENLSEGWSQCYLKDVISLVSGKDLERSEYWENPVGIPYITGASNFSNSSIETSRYTDEKYCNSYYDDILLTCKGTVGKIGYNKYEKAHVARQIMALKAFINNKYLIILLSFNIPNLVKKAKSIIPGIERKDLLYLPIQLPPLAEQERISILTNNCLDCIKQISNN